MASTERDPGKAGKPRKKRSTHVKLGPDEQLEIVRPAGSKAFVRVIYPGHCKVRKVKRD